MWEVVWEGDPGWVCPRGPGGGFCPYSSWQLPQNAHFSTNARTNHGLPWFDIFVDLFVAGACMYVTFVPRELAM